MEFKIVSPFSPTGDQPEAIAELTHGIREDLPAQTLLGVTGYGKNVHYGQCHRAGTEAYPHTQPQQDVGCPTL